MGCDGCGHWGPVFAVDGSRHISIDRWKGMFGIRAQCDREG